MRRVGGGRNLAGARLPVEGVGVLKTTVLDPLLATSTGLIVVRTRGSAVRKGDPGGPVVSRWATGPVVWGFTSAVRPSRRP